MTSMMAINIKDNGLSMAGKVGPLLETAHEIKQNDTADANTPWKSQLISSSCGKKFRSLTTMYAISIIHPGAPR